MSEVEKKSKKKKSSVNWSRQMTLKLIELYESHSNLWDCSLEQYKNRMARKTSIDAISEVMGISVQEVNDKIHSIRCQFQSINRKKKKTKSGQATGDNFVTKWEFYEALKFIDLSTSGLNETTIDSLINEEDTTDNESSYLSEDQGTNHPKDSTDTSRCNTPMPSTSTSRDFTPSSSTSQDITQAPSRLQKKDKKNDQQALLDRCVGVMSKIADSFEIFGDYVAHELRNMHLKAPDLQGYAKREIQRLILDMNDKYESRLLENGALSQSQISVNKNSDISLDNNSLESQLSTRTSCEIGSKLLVLTQWPVNDSTEDTVDGESNGMENITNYDENCESTFFNL
ncbi:uncharacterized protein [Leptinotarsa decemlineata]|uniref:uncharacterized protein n=1 Tax=Leptinotarsa decemlineata TaxID=7539 RepID=UPI003D306FFA